MTAAQNVKIGEVEDGIIARLKQANDAGVLGYNLKKLDSYGGEFADGLERIVKDFPAMFVVFNGWELKVERSITYKFLARFAVICCAQSLRNEAAARKGSDTGVGSYQMAMDVVLLIAGRNLGLDIDRFTPRGVRPLVNDKANQQLASIYAVDLETGWDIDVSEDPAGLDDFATFHANWDIPVFGNVTPPPPNDDEADATDNVTLPTS